MTNFQRCRATHVRRQITPGFSSAVEPRVLLAVAFIENAPIDVTGAGGKGIVTWYDFLSPGGTLILMLTRAVLLPRLVFWLKRSWNMSIDLGHTV